MQKRTRLTRVMAVVVALLLMVSVAAMAASKKAVVTAKSVDVYEKAKGKSAVLGTLTEGTEVTVVKVSGKVAKIKIAGKTGFVKKSAIKLIQDEKTAKPTPTPKPAKAPKATPVPAKAEAATAAIGNKKTTVRALAYAEPSTKCKTKKAIAKGTAFTLLSENGDFYKVRRAGKEAYMLKTAFAAKTAEISATPTPTPTPTPSQRVISTKTLTTGTKVFKRASKSSKVLGTLNKGASVDILAEGARFYKVKNGKQVGFIPVKAFVETKAAATPAPQAPAKDSGSPSRSVNSSKANTVIAAAMAQLGKRYVYGTTGPNTFDCSGLTYYAYKKVGVSLAHSAKSVGYGAGQKVSRANLQRGDLVCFDTISDSDLSDHVGIYIGNNQFVHASSGQARVIVSTLSGYYSERFSWGRRVI